MLSPSQEHCYCHRSDAPLERVIGKADHTTWPVLTTCCPQPGTLSSFSALTRLVRWHEGRLTCKSSATTIPRSLLLLTGLTCSNLTWNNSTKSAINHTTECDMTCHHNLPSDSNPLWEINIQQQRFSSPLWQFTGRDKVSEWVSRFLTAHQHHMGYSVPYTVK